ncbi:MAG: YibE/F family protein [Tissierellia bacterium]|nr:YibE/F family protein [Tissierellia bacterium]
MNGTKKWPVVLLAILIIFLSNRLLVDRDFLLQGQAFEHGSAKVLKILGEKEDTNLAITTQGGMTSLEVVFSAEYKGNLVTASQNISNLIPDEKKVSPGDRVILIELLSPDGNSSLVMSQYNRLPSLIAIGLGFALLLIVFGLKKGLDSLVALVLSVSMIFFVFIPMILQGKNIYLWTLLTALYSILLTIYMITGWSKKSLVTILACALGTLVAAGLSYGFSRYLHLTGGYDEATLALHRLKDLFQVDLRALIFAGITIGALGAVMDVAMDISSSLYEIRLHADIGFKELFTSGLTIGRDIMGTMTNTLILAYIGGSLSSVLMRVISSSSLLLLFNMEIIVVDLLQALLGSLALLLTAPLTALFAALFYSKIPPLKDNEPR